MWAKNKINPGFTVVELLIVIVVIAILAAIALTSYAGVQQRARDAQRSSDVANIVKSLEVYYAENGSYPVSSGSTVINNSWSTTADASWQNLKDQLATVRIFAVPSDPINAPAAFVASSTKNFSYAYFSNPSNYCGAQPRQMYLLVYRLEAAAQQNNLQGDCSSNPLIYATASNYRVVR